METKDIPGRDGVGVGKGDCGYEMLSGVVWLMPRKPTTDHM